MTKSSATGGASNSANAFAEMFQSVLTDLKASPSLWENACGKALKLSTHLNALANSLASFTDAMQAVSDNANNTKGANRDVGAALTRYCLRQRSLEQLVRAFATALADRFAGAVEKRIGEWRQRITDVERRRARALKKSRQKGGVTVARESRDALAELLGEQRAQGLFFIGAFMPAMSAQLNVLDEGAHLHEVHDSLEAAKAGHDTITIIDALLEDAQILAGGASADGRATVDFEGDGIWQRRLSMCGNRGELMKSASQYLHGQSDDGQSDIVSQYGQPLPSSASSMGSSGYSHDIYGTMHSEITDFGGTTRTNATAASCHRRALLNGNTFIPPSSASSIGGEDDLVSPSGSGDSPTMVMAGQRLPPPPPTRRRDTKAIYGSIVQQRRRGVSPAGSADTAASFSISDVSSVNSGPSAVGCLASSANDDNDGGTMRRPRPLSYNGGDSSMTYAQNKHEDAHRSNILIAETLEQIDRLGVELDSYCETLGPLGKSNRKGSAKNNSTATVVKTPQIQIQNGNQLSGNTPNESQADSATSHVRYRPDSIRIGPPPPPERRNSTITAATPTAPSIADLRGPSFEQPLRRPLASNNSSTGTAGSAGQVSQRKSSQMFDQYNFAAPPPPAADAQLRYTAQQRQQQKQQNWSAAQQQQQQQRQWQQQQQQQWDNNQHYGQPQGSSAFFASDL